MLPLRATARGRRRRRPVAARRRRHRAGSTWHGPVSTRPTRRPFVECHGPCRARGRRPSRGRRRRGGGGQRGLRADGLRPRPACTQAAGAARPRWLDRLRPGGSYYYSRTDMAAIGNLMIDGETVEVGGTAWFDHQWGDFISVGGGGWDWFAVNLDDGTDHDAVARPRRQRQLPADLRHVRRPGRDHRAPRSGCVRRQVDAHWTSPDSWATYPSGWSISIPAKRLTIGSADGRRPGARHAGHDRGGLLGGLQQVTAIETASRSPVRPTSG